MNLSQYAKEIGVSPGCVSQYVKKGVLKKSVTKNGGRYDIDSEEAAKELQRNLNKAHKVKAKPVTKQKSQKPIKLAFKPVKTKRKPAVKKPISFHDARTRKEIALATKHEFELDILQKKYVEVDEIKKAWMRHVGAVKTKLLSIPSKLTPIVAKL